MCLNDVRSGNKAVLICGHGTLVADIANSPRLRSEYFKKSETNSHQERLLPSIWYVVESSYLVDPASSHMLVSKIKPCMSKYKQVCTVKLRMAH